MSQNNFNKPFHRIIQLLINFNKSGEIEMEILFTDKRVLRNKIVYEH